MEKFSEAEKIKTNVEAPNEEAKRYDLPSEEYLNPNDMPPVPESKQENKVEVLNTSFTYQNMVGSTLAEHALGKKMSDSEIEALASSMVKEQVEAESEIKEAEGSVLIEKTEMENKQEVAEQGEEKATVFTRAVEVMKDYLAGHPKTAKLAMIGMLAYEMGNNPAMAHGYGYNPVEGIVRAGVEAVQQSGYAQMEGEQRANYNAMQGQESARYAYQNEMQSAELARQGAYDQLDNMIMQWKSQGVPEVQIGREVRSMRDQIEQRYGNSVANAQMRAQMSQQQIQMNQQQIQMQTQMRQQQIGADMGARVVNGAINGLVHGLFR